MISSPFRNKGLHFVLAERKGDDATASLIKSHIDLVSETSPAILKYSSDELRHQTKSHTFKSWQDESNGVVYDSSFVIPPFLMRGYPLTPRGKIMVASDAMCLCMGSYIRSSP